MRYKNLDKQFSDKVAEYLANGYVFYTPSMKSIESGIDARVDLIKKDTLVAIWITKDSFVEKAETYFRCDTKNLYVGEIKGFKYANNTFGKWCKEFDIIHHERYYIIGNAYENYILTDNIEEVKEAKRINRQRFDAEYYYDSNIYFTNDRALRIAFNSVKKKPRTKTVHLEDMDKVVKRISIYNNEPIVTYTVYYNTKSGSHNFVLGK